MTAEIVEIPKCPYCYPRLRPDNYLIESEFCRAFPSTSPTNVVDLNSDPVNPVVGDLSRPEQHFIACPHLVLLRIGGKLVAAEHQYEDRSVIWHWRHPWLRSHPQRATARELEACLLCGRPDGKLLWEEEFVRAVFASTLPNRTKAFRASGGRSFGIRIDVNYAAWPERFFVRYSDCVRLYATKLCVPLSLMADPLLENLDDEAGAY